ncbi:syntabulin isoform X1 [Anguilla rostrata]|uniref:syntabulin isoform X1 n=1 Tax=Anguilla rostrata TaxID=7938 RepID=UPI0030D4A4F9
MGPFQDYQEHKASEKESARSRIPRPVFRSCRPKLNGLPLSDSPFSEEESRDCDLSSDHSKRTISTNSFCSDDTGCPSSQPVSPSGSENSPLASPSPGDRKVKVKRVRVVMAEWSAPPSRHKREQRSSKKLKGSEADFSSSSSAGSIKTREALSSSTGKKSSFSRSHSAYIRSSVPAQKAAGSPAALRDKELYGLYHSLPHTPTSSNSSSNSGSSPTARRSKTGRYHSCGDNHGIKPPNPEQYLTPLQQKEVTIRHLKSKLKESESRVCQRDSEVEELKAQLGRMREDWIEEECHRVEAQLALKEARKEIKQLRQVVETMKNSLMEKDKGIQKYFIDINIQNKKLETLLHSMEMAQNGSLPEEPTLDFLCDSAPGKPMAELGDGPALEDQAAEKMADSSLLAGDEMANRSDILEHVLMSTAVDSSQECKPKLCPLQSSLLQSSVETIPTLPISERQIAMQDKSIQTDFISETPDLENLLLQLLKLQTKGNSAPNPSLPEHPMLKSPDVPEAANLTPPDPSATVLLASEGDSGQCSEPMEGDGFIEELDFCMKTSVNDVGKQQCTALVEKRYWSNSFLVDLVALAAPMVPTVAWLYSTHRGQGAPVYNIGALIRGCCVVGLHSLRQVSLGSVV